MLPVQLIWSSLVARWRRPQKNKTNLPSNKKQAAQWIAFVNLSVTYNNTKRVPMESQHTWAFSLYSLRPYVTSKMALYAYTSIVLFISCHQKIKITISSPQKQPHNDDKIRLKCIFGYYLL